MPESYKWALAQLEMATQQFDIDRFWTLFSAAWNSAWYTATLSGSLLPTPVGAELVL
ncbi:hypothetical protein O9992_20880 [Vibrio lentus]|nr:hypothetical protein [Vibrio lentus]